MTIFTRGFILAALCVSQSVFANDTPNISHGPMLGKIQFKWLCDGLKNSNSRYKVLVSGTQFGRAKSDGWAGGNYLGERKRLFSFISEDDISGVIGISGDVHRSDIYRLPIGKDRYFYDFTPGSLARTHRTPPDQVLENIGTHAPPLSIEVPPHYL